MPDVPAEPQKSAKSQKGPYGRPVEAIGGVEAATERLFRLADDYAQSELDAIKAFDAGGKDALLSRQFPYDAAIGILFEVFEKSACDRDRLNAEIRSQLDRRFDHAADLPREARDFHRRISDAAASKRSSFGNVLSKVFKDFGEQPPCAGVAVVLELTCYLFCRCGDEAWDFCLMDALLEQVGIARNRVSDERYPGANALSGKTGRCKSFYDAVLANVRHRIDNDVKAREVAARTLLLPGAVAGKCYPTSIYESHGMWEEPTSLAPLQFLEPVAIARNLTAGKADGERLLRRTRAIDIVEDMGYCEEVLLDLEREENELQLYAIAACEETGRFNLVSRSNYIDCLFRGDSKAAGTGDFDTQAKEGRQRALKRRPEACLLLRGPASGVAREGFFAVAGGSAFLGFTDPEAESGIEIYSGGNRPSADEASFICASGEGCLVSWDADADGRPLVERTMDENGRYCFDFYPFYRSEVLGTVPVTADDTSPYEIGVISHVPAGGIQRVSIDRRRERGRADLPHLDVWLKGADGANGLFVEDGEATRIAFLLRLRLEPDGDSMRRVVEVRCSQADKQRKVLIVPSGDCDCTMGELKALGTEWERMTGALANGFALITIKTGDEGDITESAHALVFTLLNLADSLSEIDDEYERLTRTNDEGEAAERHVKRLNEYKEEWNKSLSGVPDDFRFKASLALDEDTRSITGIPRSGKLWLNKADLVQVAYFPFHVSAR